MTNVAETLEILESLRSQFARDGLASAAASVTVTAKTYVDEVRARCTNETRWHSVNSRQLLKNDVHKHTDAGKKGTEILLLSRNAKG